jgi:hypothetical protein
MRAFLVSVIFALHLRSLVTLVGVTPFLSYLALMLLLNLVFGHCDSAFHASVPEETLRRLRLVFDGIVRLDAPPSSTADPAALQARWVRDAGVK